MNRQSQVSAWKRILPRLGFSLAVFLVLVALIELGVRALAPATGGRTSLIFHTAMRNAGLMVEDGELFWRFRPNLHVTEHAWGPGVLRTNDYGLRGPDLEGGGSRQTRRVLNLGDSCTFGMLVAERDTYAARLGDLLGRGWQSVNGGIPGYSSLQGLKFTRQLVPELEPKVVTLLFGWNDLKRATNGVPDAERPTLSPRQIRTRQLLLRWQTLTLLRAWTARGEPQVAASGRATSRVSPQAFAENLARIIETVERAGGRAVLITPPIAPLDGIERQGIDPTALASYHQRYVEQVRALASRWHVPLVDADRLISGNPDLYEAMPPDFIHFNAAAHARIAEALAAIVRDLADATEQDG